MKKKIIFLIIILSTICVTCFIAVFSYFSFKESKKDKELAEYFQNFYQTKLNKFEEENKFYNPYEVDVAFLGDSLTDMCDVNKFYPEYLCVNRGISGDTTFTLESRLKVSVYDLKPKVVVLLIGANNFKTMFENYENILIGLKENLPNTKIIQLSLTSMGGNHWGKNNNQAAFNNVIIKDLASKYNNIYVDLFTPLLDFNTKEIVNSYTIDGGHLTDDGYIVVSKEVKKAINIALNA